MSRSIHVQEITEFRRPEAVREHMQSLQAANWMPPCPPRFAEVKAPLPALMDERLTGTRRTNNVAKQRPLGDEDWVKDRV